jgi:hypothetical protein
VNEIAPDYPAYQIMGICDVVIGGFGSSVPMESIAGGIPALCYRPKRVCGDHFTINSFQKFCFDSYDELNDYIQFWVNADKNVIENFRQNYTMPYVDQYCDGNARKRLSELLLQIRKNEFSGLKKILRQEDPMSKEFKEAVV